MTSTTTKMTPGDEIHLTLLMAPYSLNFFTGQDRQHLLAYGRAAFEAGLKIADAAEQAAWHAGLDEGRAQKSCLVQIQEPAPVLAAQPEVLAAIFAARGALQHLKEGGKPTEVLINCALQAIDSVAESHAAPAAVAVPDGWKLVPVVSTPEMGWAYLDKAREVSPGDKWKFSHPGYEAALSAAPQPPAFASAPAADEKSFLSEDDLDDLRRFEGMASDGEGYDISKKRMKRLAELGVVRWVGGSRYCVTAFGQYVLKSWGRLPLETYEEANARVGAEFMARIDRLNAEAITAQTAQGGE